jgi:hypothetical protein
MDNCIDLGRRWTEEYGEHLKALQPEDIDIFEYSKVMQKWMRQWESVWDFPM